MASKTVAKPRNAVGEAGYTGFSGVQQVDVDIPEGYKPAIVYKNARGKLVDPYGRPVKELGTHQEAGIAGTEEQKASVSYNAPEGVRSGTSSAEDADIQTVGDDEPEVNEENE